MKLRLTQRSALPGLGATLGFSVLYLCLLVLIPLSGLALKTLNLSWQQFWTIATSPRLVASYKLTVGTSLAAAIVNGVMGFIVAWVLVRYRFPGRKIVDAMIDLPFALPTAVSGIVLTTIYAPTGWIGKILANWGIKVAFTPLGITVALIFIGMPFVVRTLQPAMEELDQEIQDAAMSLGATRWQTFWKVIFPGLLPALIAGFAMSFARALGEYGSVVFIAGNLPGKTEITSLLIITRLEEYDYAGATAIAVIMLGASFALMLVINLTQAWSAKRYGGVRYS